MTIADLATVNVVLGPNGAGKTSLFEAIFTLAHGRSFRRFGGKRDALVSLSAEHLIVYGETTHSVRRGGLVDEGVSAPNGDGSSASVKQKIGISKSRLGETRIKRNGVAVKRMSEITEQLPVIAVNADTFDLLSGPPQERRAFLDWSVFHVEHSYKDDVKLYARALAQRNALLRSFARQIADKSRVTLRSINRKPDNERDTPQAQLHIWTDAMARAGEQVDARRLEIFNLLNEEFKRVLPDLGLESYSLSLFYRRGWDAKSNLAQALRDSEETDVARGFSSVGPHRGDVQITIEVDGHRRLARDVLSRGQLKLTIFALKLSQLRLLRYSLAAGDDTALAGGAQIVLLLDDVAAELDPVRLRSIGAIISEAMGGVQVFVNGTTEALLSPFLEPFEAASLVVRKFHVEHGRLL